MWFERRDFSPGGLAPDAQDLRTRLPSGCWMVEIGGQPPGWHDPDLLLGERARNGGLAISLRSSTLLATDLGLTLDARLAAEGCRLPALAGLAIHEILVNAVVHGNLGVGSGAATQWGDLALRQQLIETALADPSRAGRMVSVAAVWDAAQVRVSVADEGKGYATEPDAPPASQARRAAGRGLFIARAAGQVTVAPDGRCTYLVLPCHVPAAVG